MKIMLPDVRHCCKLKIRTWTRTEQKPYKCQLCQKLFSHISNLKTHNPVSTGILPHSLPEWALRARPGLWRICLCPKVARIAEHKFGSRYGKVRAKILFPYWAPNLVPNNAINLGAQLGPVSITKLSPNWACQMGPIHFINFFAVWVCLFRGRRMINVLRGWPFSQNRVRS